MASSLFPETKSEKDGPALSLSLNDVRGRLDGEGDVDEVLEEPEMAGSGDVVVAYALDAARRRESAGVPMHFSLPAQTAMVEEVGVSINRELEQMGVTHGCFDLCTQKSFVFWR